MMAGIFVEAVNRSIAAGWLVLAAAALRLVLRRSPRWVNLLLWGMVALRLLCPVSIESRFSLIPDARPVTEGFAGGSFLAEPLFGENGAGEAMSFAGEEDGQGRSGLSEDGLEGDKNQAGGNHGKGSQGNRNQAFISVLTAIWLSGAGLMLCYALFSYLKLRRQVREAVLLRDHIFCSEKVDSPFVLGVVKPRIYIPFQMRESHLEMVALHEQTHIRRGDHLWKPVGFCLLSVYWFHPLLWLAYVLLCRDMELACDEKVIKGLDRERRADYSQALLDCSVRPGGIRACPLAFGEAGVKKRVKSVLNYRKPGFWAVWLAAAACVAAAVCFLTNPVRRDTLAWAQALEAGDVAEADVVIYSDFVSPDKRYKKLSKDDITVMVSLISRSRGSYVEEHEEGDGGSIFFHLAMADGAVHEVGNMGNMYLVIDGDYYEADYGWLSSWEDAFPEGDGPLPEDGAFPREDGAFSREDGALSREDGASPGEDSARRLTLEDVTELARKGEDLGWADFQGFMYTDVGSGLYVYRYEIDGTFDLFIGGPDAPGTGAEPMYIRLQAKAAPGWATGESIDIRTEDAAAFIRKHQDPQALTEAVVWEEADLDRDGETEVIRVRETIKEENYVLEVLKKDGSLLWSEEAGMPHTGWNTLLLYREGGEDYLIRYQPNLSQGIGSYTCEQFSLADGAETLESFWEADFALASGEVTGRMRAFAEQANQFLKEGTVLLSTQDGALAVGPRKAEELSWLYPVRFFPEDMEPAQNTWADFGTGLPVEAEPLKFVLASGAGSWGTSLTLYPDGSFQGVYENGENIAAEDYPRGTRYLCRFSGRFEEITKTGEYTCSMRLAELDIETEEGRVWVEDSARYIGAEALGVEDGEEFIFYLPGIPIEELDEEFWYWSPDYYLWSEGEIDRLASYGLQNVETGHGFFTNWHS